eukprot:6187523-Pleurochrysis_carterae.AAC.1
MPLHKTKLRGLVSIRRSSSQLSTGKCFLQSIEHLPPQRKHAPALRFDAGRIHRRWRRIKQT